jgi:hypothetical protein
MTQDILLYGLRIRSEVPLPGRPAEPGNGAPLDLEISLGPEAEPEGGPPPGTVLAHHELSPTQWYTFTQLVDGSFLLRFADICDFSVDATLRCVEVRVAKGGSPEWVAVFAGGALLSFILVMKGEPLLHASAVDVGGAALAFVGRSGMGKSTMATLSCAAGGHLITDDVLRLTTGVPPRCYLGPDEIRLRAWATELTSAFSEPLGQRRTGDGRDAVQVPLGAPELLPLAAVVVPLPDRAATEVVLKRLDPMNSLVALLSFPRILGWVEPLTQAQQFKLLSDISGRVPVYQARIPWGPPFPDGVVRDLLEGTGAAAVAKRSEGPS